eukprot:CAMPEP_0204117414 /NCGR_PEP_ID=MMETSP0361-20130328/5958_1 /ASSEMBLY_ACC=CAM_ASM_000343 /TAXON_ID=268821 /ORGANISM="Scrippsiella Hangoei, Strain SHTV-5" /LENGTH=227 /DNA_ID=CAMNT_0051068307 /DNA_START=473 /DNA_END=1153 /DNA_ORIENTATION=-
MTLFFSSGTSSLMARMISCASAIRPAFAFSKIKLKPFLTLSLQSEKSFGTSFVRPFQSSREVDAESALAGLCRAFAAVKLGLVPWNLCLRKLRAAATEAASNEAAVTVVPDRPARGSTTHGYPMEAALAQRRTSTRNFKCSCEVGLRPSPRGLQHQASGPPLRAGCNGRCSAATSRAEQRPERSPPRLSQHASPSSSSPAAAPSKAGRAAHAVGRGIGAQDRARACD